jgi:predicted RNase H-like nuclease
MLVAGVDGCHGGWLCLLLDTSNGKTEIRYLREFAAFLRQEPKPKVIAIDIPIGLWEKGDRPCDKKARALLGWPRRCSVFPPPPRSALRAKSYGEAKRLSRRASGKSLTRQCYGILKKIREVDD